MEGYGPERLTHGTVHLPGDSSRIPLLRVHPASRTVLETNGVVYHLDRLKVTDSALYYGCSFQPGERFMIFVERWLLPSPMWTISRFTMPSHTGRFWCDWYVDFDRIVVDAESWNCYNCLLDAGIHEGVGYEVEDADELAEAIQSGSVSIADASAALRSLGLLGQELRALRFSGMALLKKHGIDPETVRS